MQSDSVTVLVVDDEALIRLTIADELVAHGFLVLEAGGADEAIATIEKYPEIRLIFTDIDMPGSMDGLKLAAFVRDRWPPIKIIITSGRIEPEADLIPAGAAFFRKPYDYSHVVATVSELIAT